MTEWGIYSPDCHLFFLFLLGDSPNSEKEHSGFELARLVAQRIPNGHGLLFRLIANKHLHRPRPLFLSRNRSRSITFLRSITSKLCMVSALNADFLIILWHKFPACHNFIHIQHAIFASVNCDNGHIRSR